MTDFGELLRSKARERMARDRLNVLKMSRGSGVPQNSLNCFMNGRGFAVHNITKLMNYLGLEVVEKK